MRIIQPSVALIDEKDPYKKIELAGRTCYKSEDKITDTSAAKFVGMLIKHGHLAMVEHAVFCFYTITNKVRAQELESYYEHPDEIHVTNVIINNEHRVIITANLRTMIENNLVNLNEDYSINSFKFVTNEGMTLCDFETDIVNKTAEEILKHRYTTMRFITDRGVTHELVRHRKCSFAQESTRYVNYTKNNMLFIEPIDYKNWSPQIQGCFLSLCSVAEDNYRFMMENGLVAQLARAILPNALKTELVITTYDEEWRHIFELRCDKAAHPDCRNVMNMAKSIYLSVYGLDALN